MPALVILCAIAATLGLKVKHVGSFLWNCATASVEILASSGEPYEALDFWAGDTLCRATNHVLAKTTSSGSNTVNVKENDDEEYVSEADNSSVYYLRHVSFTPAVGTHIFFYHYWPFLLIRREIREGWFQTESLRLVTVFWQRSSIQNLLLEARLAYADRDKNKTGIYHHQEEHGRVFWCRFQTSPIRSLSTVIMDKKKKNELIHDMEQYLQPGKRHLYAKRGIPYRRGYLFSGPPGTGKTSLCYAAAGFFRLNIYYLNLNSLTDNGLGKLMSILPKRCMLLLEDLDSNKVATKQSNNQQGNNTVEKPYISNQKEEGKSRISLSFLLNAIDGLGATEGRVLIITANNPESINSTLIRGGRIDYKIEFDYAGFNEAKQLFHLMYPTDDCQSIGLPSLKLPVGGIVSKEDFEIHADKFAASFSAKTISPKKIQDYLLGYLHDPKQAASMVNDWVKKIEEDNKNTDKKVEASS
ncbi:hypothetical protein Plec18167_006167 [Paecilomyces lecythidis]|uniref:P-loop containing nucleoside triphosphate hydrolase protein n=1 Tax=Paecilomyces lecythidis TaxID=3004212 RepID=A0ABR3XCX7_9EURO